MTGIRPRRALLRNASDTTDGTNFRTLERIRAEKIMNIDNMQASMDSMHRNAKNRSNERR